MSNRRPDPPADDDFDPDSAPTHSMLRQHNHQLLSLFATPKPGRQNRLNRPTASTDVIEPHFGDLTPQAAASYDLSHLTAAELDSYGFEDSNLGTILSAQLYPGYMVHLAKTVHANLAIGEFVNPCGPAYNQMLVSTVSRSFSRLPSPLQRVLRKKASNDTEMSYLQVFIDVLQRKPAVLGAALINPAQQIQLDHAMPLLPCPFCMHKMSHIQDEFYGMLPNVLVQAPRGPAQQRKLKWAGNRTLSPLDWDDHMSSWRCPRHFTTAQAGDKSFYHKSQLSLALHKLLGKVANNIRTNIAGDPNILQSFTPVPPPAPNDAQEPLFDAAHGPGAHDIAAADRAAEDAALTQDERDGHFVNPNLYTAPSSTPPTDSTAQVLAAGAGAKK